MAGSFLPLLALYSAVQGSYNMYMCKSQFTCGTYNSATLFFLSKDTLNIKEIAYFYLIHSIIIILLIGKTILRMINTYFMHN